MSDSTSDPHARFSLGLYLLGTLGEQEREEIEHHLAICAECRMEADELGDVVAALALLSEDDGREIVETFGVQGSTPVVKDRRATPTLSKVATRPASTRPGGPRRRRLRTRGLLGVAGLVLVVLISAGVFVGVSLGGSRSGRTTPVDITLAATADDTTTGASLAVVATGHDSAATIRATVTGLHHDTRYQLYLVTSDGRTRVVATWVGSDTPQDVVGHAPVRVTDMSFFTLTLSDGTPVVSAYLPRPTPSTRR